MGIAVAKLKQTRAETRTARAPVLPRKSPAAARAPLAAKPELAANGRTRLANDCGKLANEIFRFTDKHKLPPSLRRRLRNCAADLWDVEMDEDAQSGALDKSAFGEMARRASRDHKEGKTFSLEELKARLR